MDEERIKQLDANRLFVIFIHWILLNDSFIKVGLDWMSRFLYFQSIYIEWCVLSEKESSQTKIALRSSFTKT